MARCSVEGFGDLFSGLDALGADIDKIADEALDNAAPEMVDSLKQGIREAANRGYATGELADSVVPARAKKNRYGHFASVGVHGKDKKGVRNNEKLAYLECGTSRQSPRSVIAKAVKRAEEKCMEKVQETIDKYIEQQEK